MTKTATLATAGLAQMIPLAKLELSKANIRQSGYVNVEQLAADILARGVIQNLSTTPITKPRGHFAVYVGGRRLAALRHLVETGAIDASFEVPCTVLKADDATLSEISLAENFQRMAMSPAEECRAFQHFLTETNDIDAVAKRFGVTRRFIEGRLRLASLAEPVFSALAEGELTLDMAKAYASTENTEKQLRVFEQMGSYGYATADMVRRAIANDSLQATDPIAVLVGEEAYAAEGGRVERELFSDAGDRWTDPEIVQRLAAAKMEAEGKRIGEELGLAWVRPIATGNVYAESAGLHRVRLPSLPLTDEEQARSAIIEEHMDALATELDEGEVDEETAASLEAEYDALDLERAKIHLKTPVLPDELKGLVGVFLTLDQTGAMVLDTSYFSEEPIRSGEAGEDAGGQSPVNTVPVGGSPMPPRPDTVAPGGKPMSARLLDELAIQRRDILAASILGDPALALDYALFALVDAAKGYVPHGTTIKANRPDDPVLGSDMPGSHAKTMLAEAKDALDVSWTEHVDIVTRFEAFRLLADDAKGAWMAYAVAGSLEAKPGYDARINPLQARLATILEIDVAQWWRPTSVNYFDRVSKGTSLALLEEIGGPALSGRYASSKKGEISQSCEKLFAGQAITEPEIKEAALAWLPDAMRFTSTTNDTDGSEDGEDEAVEVPTDEEGTDEAATHDTDEEAAAVD